jgi:hypothetical protein
MLQDSRIGNSYGYPLLLISGATVNVDNGYASIAENVTTQEIEKFDNASRAVLETYAKLQTWVKNHGDKVSMQKDFCNSVVSHIYDGSTPCSKRYPKARYFQVNLVPLDRIGTIEFRAFPATTSVERALKWVNFIVSFVEHFKDDRRFIDQELARGDKDSVDVEPLRTAQREASLKDLADELSMDAKWMAYWQQRDWLQSEACRGESPRSALGDQEDKEQDEVQDLLESGNMLPITIDDEDGQAEASDSNE